MHRSIVAAAPLGGLFICPLCRRDWSGTTGSCESCRANLGSGLQLPGLVALGYYRGNLSRAVRAYKYGQVRNLSALLARRLANLIRERGWRPLVVTHVPLHPGRKRSRGFDQAALLARCLAAALDLPWRPLLERERPTPQQARLKAAERRRNVQRAFRSSGPAKGTVLLVDDVFTTGATLGECREVIEAAGATAVLLAVLAVAAQTRRPRDEEVDQKATKIPLAIPSSAPTRT